MNKPKEFEKVQGLSTYEPLAPGCYVCKIMQVVEKTNRSGKPMVVISLDIAEGEEKDRFAKAYKEDTREDKKWGCVVYQNTEDKDGNAAKGFKGFIEAVKESNSGWKEEWGDKFCENFKGKLIGGKFGREEYEKQTGGTAWAIKCMFFDTVERVRSGKCKTPADRPLPQNSTISPDGFTNIPDGLADELPFN